MIRVFDILIVTIFVFVQWRVSRGLLGVLRPRIPAAWAVAVLFNLAIAAAYLCTFSELLSYAHVPPRLGMLVGAASLSYLLIAVSILAGRSLLPAVDRYAEDRPDPGRRRALQIASRAALATPALVLGYGTFLERHDFRVREIDVPFPDLPPGLDGLRLLHLSDIHLSAFLSESEFAAMVDAANELRPHVAAVTGDLITTHGDPLDECLRQLARLKADAGVVGCLGNHERYAGAEDYTAEAAARLGMRFLRGAREQLRFGGSVLNIAGVDYQGFGESYLHGARSWTVPGAFNLMLSHNPDVFPAAVQRGYNLLLAGHTHGGQLSIEILDRQINVARLLTPYVYGLYRSGGAAAYVTRGIGTVGIPARVGAPPEIALLRLRKA